MDAREFLATLKGRIGRTADFSVDELTELAFMLLEQGGNRLGAGDNEGAIAYYDQALVLARHLEHDDYEVDALFGTGTAASRLGDRNRARELFSEVLALAEARADPVRAGLALHYLANAYQGEDRDEAIRLNERALAVGRLDPETVVRIRLNLATMRAAAGDFGQALSDLELAGMLARDTAGDEGLSDAVRTLIARIDAARDGPLPADAVALVANYESRATEALRRGANAEALDFQGRCLDVFRRHGHVELVATALRNIGYVHAETGAYDRAIDVIQHALVLFDGLRHDDGIARCRQLLASCHEGQADYAQALEQGVLALASAGVSGSAATLVLSLTTLGLTYRGLGHYALALACHQTALDTARQTGDVEGVASNLNNIGLVWWHRGDNREAVAYFEESLAESRTADRRSRMAGCLNNLALVYHGEGDVRRAVECFQDAIAIDREFGREREVAIRLGNLAAAVEGTAGDFDLVRRLCDESTTIARRVGDQATVARGLLTRGMTEQRQSDLAAALGSFRESLEVNRAIGDPHGIVRSLQCVGCALDGLGRYGEARDVFQDAVAMARTKDDAELLAAGLTGLAGSLIALGEPAAARNRLLEATIVVEELRLLSSPGWRSRARRFEAFVGPYVMLIECVLWSQGEYETALEFVERLKARTLLELLAERDLDLPRHLPDALADEYRRLRRQRRELDFALDLMPRGPADAIERRRQQRRDVDASLAALEQQIETQAPGFLASATPPALRVSDIRDALPDARTVIVELFSGTARTFLFVVDKHRPVTSLAVDACTTADVMALFERWSSAYVTFVERQDQAGWRACLDNVLETLGRILLPAIERALPPEATRLVFVPHHAFHRFPLHAMSFQKDGRRVYVIERYECVSYAPSAAVYVGCRRRTRPRPDRLLAVENPTGDLRFAEAEVEAVASLFPNRIVLGPKRNASATKANLLREARDAHVVLCTGHSVGGDSARARLLLSGETMTLAEQFATLELPVCSIWDYDTCETGIPEVDLADEWVALARAPLQAGAAMVWSSLWAIDDLATAHLKALAYRNIVEGHLDPVRALNDAQRAMLTGDFSRFLSAGLMLGERHRHPYYWAGFIASGTS